MEVPQDLDLLTYMIEAIACGSVQSCGILVEGYGLIYQSLHLTGTTDELTDIEASHGDRQETYGREHREAPTDIVRDDEGLVALLVSEGT